MGTKLQRCRLNNLKVVGSVEWPRMLNGKRHRNRSATASLGCSRTHDIGNPVTDDVFREGPQVSQRRYPIISYPYGDFIPASLWECRTQVRFRLAKQHLPELLVACPGSSQKFTSTRTNQRTCSPGSRLGQQQQHQRQYRRHHPPPQS
ncbi:predicted protein [Chaetomium globosum CBS 148.51]|uniref:Uncharacterized protein n=1 Tax=Chaetomium globosum (strain ATCC 6205 / CBS 148.51 / DSM 1962 / NBRC 6347 / NRRL 1970) TaxID=306901 RepID=Q2GPG4_CHAGB|nr:uncharacterized protein CHGG_10140 [Chaetomium globosum CBS 148.51]EAQ83736.1 predicted protein [Chaetomium globosum CBS 148.51]